MEIIKKTEGMTAGDLYSLTKGNNVRKMADFEGEVLDVLKYVLYKDINGQGEETVVLALETVAGAKIATNSKTFIRNFADILAMYAEAGEDAPTRFIVGSGTSRSGRHYLTCDIAP